MNPITKLHFSPHHHLSFLALLFLLLFLPSSALLHLHSKPFSFTFLDEPARFAVPVDRSGICGSLHVARPINACSPINRTHDQTDRIRFVLILRGDCSFDEKVRNAQDGGFEAAIIYDDQEKSGLYSMIGDPTGVHIHAVFVSKLAGETLKRLARGEAGECCINSSYDETAGTVLLISFISLLVIISVVSTFLFARNFQILRGGGVRDNGQPGRQRGMERREVELIPCFVFRSDNYSGGGECVVEICPICLEDYRDGERIRVLPCKHEFHLVCVDSWLTRWSTSCPVCKHQVNS